MWYINDNCIKLSIKQIFNVAKVSNAEKEKNSVS